MVNTTMSRGTSVSAALLLVLAVLEPLSAGGAESEIRDLPELIRVAPFAIVFPETVDRARQQLVEAVDQLDRALASHPDVNGWKTYLQWDVLQAQLRAGQSADPQELARIRSKLIGNHAGLETRAFTEVRNSLDRFRTALEDLANPDLRKDFDSHLEQLADSVASYLAAPDAGVRQEIARQLGWLERRGQAAQATAAVRQHLSRPNLLVVFPKQAVNEWFHTQLDEPGDVQDVILGTRISGTERTTGTVSSVLVPDDDRGVIQIELDAISDGTTVGSNGPVRIYQDNHVKLRGRKQIVFDSQGLRSVPAKSDAEISSQVTGLGTTAQHRIVDWVIRRKACRRVTRQKDQADCLAEDHQRQQLRTKLDHDVDEQLAAGRAELNASIFSPLKRLDLFPRQLDAQTSEDRLEVLAQFASAGQLGANGEPPSFADSCDLILQIHASAAENILASLVGGKVLRVEEFIDPLFELMGKSAVTRRSRFGQEVLVAFDVDQPFAFQVNEGEVAVTMRGRGFRVDGHVYGAANATFRYRLETVEGQLRATRTGEIETVSPDSNQDRPSALARELKRKLQKELPTEIVLNGAEPNGPASAIKDLRVVRLTADRGWLTAECQQER